MEHQDKGKRQSQRIELDYHRTRTWLDVSRSLAIALGLICAGVYAAAVLFWDQTPTQAALGARALHLSTGPVTTAHAFFENDCQKCHSDSFGVAISHDAWQINSLDRLSDQENKCQECHKVQGHFRTHLVHEEMDRDCARCHRDHQGRMHDLVAVASRTCTECHSKLNAACLESKAPRVNAEIVRFDEQSHGVVPPDAGGYKEPQFRSLLVDTGRIKFDHAQHLMPGQVNPGNKGAFQFGMLPEALRNRYRPDTAKESDKAKWTDNDFVQLTCNHCHEPSGVGGLSKVNAFAESEGRFYAPVNFKKHCEACHQLTFAGQQQEQLSLPHFAQREEYASLLRAKMSAGKLQGSVAAAKDQAQDGGAPDKYDPRALPVAVDTDRIEAAVNSVFDRCQQCHLPEDTQAPVIAKALAGVLPPMIPERWLQRGFFNHAAHSTISQCNFCHEVNNGIGSARDQNRVAIKGPESCTPCHRDQTAPPPKEFADKDTLHKLLGPESQKTWSSSECVKCHRYHWSRPEANALELTQLGQP